MNKPDFNTLNTEQRQAVEKTEGAVLVTAGAGSGKTRVLTYRIAHLISMGVPAHNILAVTFTNKAAAEMRERVQHLTGQTSANNVWLYTVHSMCVQILRQNRNIERLSGYTINFSIYDQTDRERILKQLIAEKKVEDDDFLNKICYHISNCKNNNYSLEQYANQIGYYHNAELILGLMKEYEDKMNANNALDFDSLLTYTYKLLAQNLDVREYYQNKFRYIHIDEFQDTNKVQYDLVALLSAQHKNVFVVGDEDQCIYTWRGANASHIFKFITEFAPVTVIKLEQNYRSTKKIIDLANKVISHNNSRLEKKLWTGKEDGVKVEYKAEYNERAEATYVVEQIYNLIRMGTVQPSEIAVLMRLNALTRNIEEKCLEYNLPYRVFGGMKFYDRLEIKNILAYLKLLVNHKDGASFNRVINFPKRGIGEAALLSLKQQMQPNQSPMEAVLNLDESANLPSGALNKLLGFKAIMQDLIQQKDELSLSDFVEYTIQKTGTNEAYNSGKEEDESRLYNLSELISSVAEFERANPKCTLEEYLQSVSLTSDIDDYDETKETITLATVHSVKGLEFKAVFIIGCEENIFPMKRKDSTDEDMEEERRLMYVAITRAKERLYLTGAQSRFLYGESRYTLPSRFLKEAGLVSEKPKQESTTQYNLSGGFIKDMLGLDTQDLPSINRQTIQKVQIKEIVKTIKVKDRVSHPKFGVGIVLSISGALDTRTATVLFEGIGTKTLALNFAPLTIL